MGPQPHSPKPVPARLSRLIARLVFTSCDLFLLEVHKPYFTFHDQDTTMGQQQSKMFEKGREPQKEVREALSSTT